MEKINRSLRIYLLVLLMIPLTAQSSWKRDWLDNWLIGVSGGYADREGGLRSGIVYGGLPTVTPAQIIIDDSDTGWLLGLLAGYQGTHEKWLVGAEANLDWHPIDDSHLYEFSDPGGRIGWTAVSDYKRRWMVGLTGRLGYALADNFRAYVRFGTEIGRDKLNTFFTANPAVLAANMSILDKTWVYRFLSGVGVEMPIPCTLLTVRCEYNFHSKGRTLKADGIFIDGVVNPIFNSAFQPKTQSVRIALIRNIF